MAATGLLLIGSGLGVCLCANKLNTCAGTQGNQHGAVSWTANNEAGIYTTLGVLQPSLNMASSFLLLLSIVTSEHIRQHFVLFTYRVQVRDEIIVQQQLKHPFVVGIHAAYQCDCHVYLLMDLAPGGELHRPYSLADALTVHHQVTSLII